jgi:hypothetical protein
MGFSSLVALACAVWLLSCGASVLALYWSIKAGSQRRRAAVIMSCLGLLSGYFGLSLIHVKAWRTVNGHLEWSINSRWFFLAAVVLGAASLALAVWNWRKACSCCTTAPLTTRDAGGSADEPGAPPNGGPAELLGISEVGGGPPSVS